MADQAPFNASDPKQVHRRQSSEKTKRLRLDSGFMKLMGDSEGRLWVWEFLSRCGIYRTTFNQSNSQTAFNEGVRNAGLMIMADIHRLCPELYLRMINEQTVQVKEASNG